MTLNNSSQSIIENRRATVARLRLRGLTQREIVAALAQQGQDFSLGTVNRDLQVIGEQWRQDARADIAELRARQFAELREVRRIAWKAGQLDTVLKSLAQEAKLLGSDAPTKVDVSWRDNLPPGYDGDEVLRQFTELMQQAKESINDGRSQAG